MAVKRVLRDGSFRSGINLGALKELQSLPEVPHPRLLSLLDAFAYGDRVHLVLEYAVADLTALIRDRAVSLPEAAVKGYALQMLDGLAALHSRHWMHRDLKPDNVLITASGAVKLADFGHAARVPLGETGTTRGLFFRVVTLWYRPPELLMQARHYGPAVDMWSFGCILAELIMRQPLFAGADEADQLARIFRLLGTPVDPRASTGGDGAATGAATRAEAAKRPGGSRPPPPWAWRRQCETPAADTATLDDAVSCYSAVRSRRLRREAEASGARPATSSVASAGATTSASAAATSAGIRGNLWPGSHSLPGYTEHEHRDPQPWRAIVPASYFPAASPLALDLLAKCLIMDPARRITAADALRHPWFAAAPPPLPAAGLPLPAVAYRARGGGGGAGAVAAGAVGTTAEGSGGGGGSLSAAVNARSGQALDAFAAAAAVGGSRVGVV